MDASAGTLAALDGLSDADRDTYAAFVRIADDAERAAAITAWGRQRGNLRKPFTTLRTDALIKARRQAERDGRKLTRLARRVGFDPSRLSRLTRASSEGAAA
ncbi:hypothetical protein Drose_05960 [Dactylosporangium roseum]|uniref:Mor transcription activator domain-containing protein n=1 Tax=Dactylosporangium roseum TaxID=47989 RepID=A0ABY5Z8D2_9ACTN|nr:hypothetical protein [Dactylosporangium roseum]UWZ37816.1 hypothetical protein Drose_05960 [Dactylosporangium roseum]